MLSKRTRMLLGFLAFVWCSVPAVSGPSPEQIKTLVDEGIAHLKSGNAPAAAEAFQRAIEINAGIPQLHNLLGLSLSQSQETFQNALDAYQRALSLDPKNADIYFNLASLFAGQSGDMIMAEEYFLKAIELDPKSARAYTSLGWLYLTNKHDPQSAVLQLEKAAKLNPSLARAQYGLGMAYASLGKPENVLKPISMLRSLKENDWARSLEETIHGAESAEPVSSTPPPARPPQGGVSGASGAGTSTLS